MLSELVHYKHLNISARVITFITITQHAFVLYAFMHSKSIFLCACVITRVAFKCPFLQLFVISIKVRSQSILFGTHVLALVTIYHLFCLYIRLFFKVPVPVHYQSIDVVTYLFTLVALELVIFLVFWWNFTISEHMSLTIFLLILLQAEGFIWPYIPPLVLIRIQNKVHENMILLNEKHCL